MTTQVITKGTEPQMAVIKSHERLGRGVRGCVCCAEVTLGKIRATDARRARQLARQQLRAGKDR